MKHIKLFEAVVMADAKDIKRIEDLSIRAKGDDAKALQLASTMARLINDKNKAMRRYEAAEEVLGADHDITKVFADRAIELGNKIDTTTSSTTSKKTHGKLGSEISTDRVADTAKRTFGRPYAILPLGVTSLQTGKCQHFNIFETWDDDESIELWQDNHTKKYKLIFTSSNTISTPIGTERNFQHDQTQRPLFYGELVDWVNQGDANLLVRKYNIKSAPGYVYK